MDKFNWLAKVKLKKGRKGEKMESYLNVRHTGGWVQKDAKLDYSGVKNKWSTNIIPTLVNTNQIISTY